jgi:DNA-binding transcriptional MerR regulator
MQLKVGELARRSGLTVRALHHYDEIGLLKPSLRSPAGYRLYGRADVARLHAIQSLRSLGVPLAQMAGMLAGDGSDLPAIVARQLRALDSEIAQATALRERLALLQDMLAAGRQPEVDDWLGTLELMGTYTKYFSAEEVRRIVGRWPRVAAVWPPLVSALQEAMDRGQPPADPEVQALVQRWMAALHDWLDGDFELMRRWGQVYASEPRARGSDRTDGALVRYVEQASALRLAIWQRHFTLDELARLRRATDAGLQALQREVAQARARRLAANAPAALRLAERWQQLLTQAAGGDEALGQRLRHAYGQEPALRAGAPMPEADLDFLLAAAQAHDEARESGRRT